MADAEARKQMMEAALLLQKEFKNPEPDPFRKKKGLNAASRNRAVPKHPVAPSIPVLANRAPAKIPGLTPSGRTPNPFIGKTMKAVFDFMKRLELNLYDRSDRALRKYCESPYAVGH